MIMLISVKHLPAQTSNDILQDPRTSCKINASHVNVYKGVLMCIKAWTNGKSTKVKQGQVTIHCFRRA